jgi:hypothetical protein
MVLRLIRGAAGWAVASHSGSCAQTFMMYGTLSGASLRRRRASARINSLDTDTGRPLDRRMDGTLVPPVILPPCAYRIRRTACSRGLPLFLNNLVSILPDQARSCPTPRAPLRYVPTACSVCANARSHIFGHDSGAA